jgi:HEAT repeat protein
MANERDTTSVTAARATAPAVSLGAGGELDAPVPFTAEHQKAVVALLRQLASGLSAYRMFPGDLKQSTFVQVVSRIESAAEAALAWGPLDAEISGTTFVTASGPVPGDERIQRLALALYQHRAERLTLLAVPQIHDLGVLYEALSKESNSEEVFGVGAALRVAGVDSLVIREVTPQPTGDEEIPITDEQRALWDKLGQADVMARELVEAVAHLPTMAEAAQEVFARLDRMLRLLPADIVGGFEFYARMHEVVVQLPKSLRRAVMRVLLAKVRDEPLAERMIGTMTDAGLARVLVDQGVDGGPDPVETAKWLVRSGIRNEDVADLTMALKMGRVEGGTILAGLERVGIHEGPTGLGPTMARTVSSLLARGLIGVGQEDVQAIREAFPTSPEQVQDIVFGALYDYLRAEDDPERLGGVLEVWGDEVAAALRARDFDRVTTLLRVTEWLDDDRVTPEKQAVVESTLRRVVSSATLGELISVADDDSTQSTVKLLAPFGGAAVDELLDNLAQERDRGRRAVLLAVLSEVARGHHDRVAERLADPRWFVARNAVTILYRSGDRDVLPRLVQASHHAEAPVRREAARGLLAVAGLDVLPELMALASDPDDSVRSAVISAMGGLSAPGVAAGLAHLVRTLQDPTDRRKAIDALARHPAPEAADALAGLASSSSRPKLPRRIRRYAKTLAQRRREGKP